MLIYPVYFIPLHSELIQVAEEAYCRGTTLLAQSGAMRKAVPWQEIYRALWEKEQLSFSQHVLSLFKPG
jgi:hypothetical protein